MSSGFSGEHDERKRPVPEVPVAERVRELNAQLGWTKPPAREPWKHMLLPSYSFSTTHSVPVPSPESLTLTDEELVELEAALKKVIYASAITKQQMMTFSKKIADVIPEPSPPC